MDQPPRVDPVDFRSLGHALVDAVADHLAAVHDGPVLPPRPPADLLEQWQLDPGGGADPQTLWNRYLDSVHRVRHPGSVGHQVAPPHQLAVLTQLVRALHANSAAIFEMGPAATAIERHVVRWMCDQLGFDRGTSGGLLTSGGSLGNLTALLAMRQARATHDVWREGLGGSDRLTVFSSAQTHYCVARALQVLGLGEASLVKVPTDTRFRLDVDALRTALAACRRAGRQPAAVVASACSTSTGAIDPLADIAQLCDDQGLWLHVDGAHGASFVLSERERPKLAGIERADSVVWDAHKTLLCNSLVTGVLFRDRRHAEGAFAPAAEYLFQQEGTADERANLDLGRRTLECTKPAFGLELHLLLSVLGERQLAAYLEHMVDLVADFAADLDAADDFELAHQPDVNIVCFRHRPSADADGHDLDAWQERLRAAVLATGEFYLTLTTLKNRRWLRCTVLNPDTRAETLRDLLAALRAAAAVTADDD